MNYKLGQFDGRKLCILAVSVMLSLSAQSVKLLGAKPAVSDVAVIKIQKSDGETVSFTPKGEPKLEIVNDRLNLALSSREGMIFEITGVPAKHTIAARRYSGPEFRALLLHTPFQEEAATDDPFEQDAVLEIRDAGTSGAKGGAFVEIRYTGRLRAGVTTLDVHFEFSASLPASRRFIEPTKQTPSS